MPDDYNDVLAAAFGSPQLNPRLSEFAKETGLAIGSTTSGTHNKNSRHYTGNAFDVRGSGGFSNARVEQLKAEAASRGLLVRDERTRPPNQKVWGGAHVHIEVPVKPTSTPTPQSEYGDVLDAAFSSQESSDYGDVLGAAGAPEFASVEGLKSGRFGSVDNLVNLGLSTVPEEPTSIAQSATSPEVRLSIADAAWHFGVTPDEARRLTPKARQVLMRAVAGDELKKSQGQPILPPPLRYQNERRKEAGLKPLQFNVAVNEEAVAPYYKPEVGTFNLGKMERRGGFWLPAETDVQRLLRHKVTPQEIEDNAQRRARAELEQKYPSSLDATAPGLRESLVQKELPGLAAKYSNLGPAFGRRTGYDQGDIDPYAPIPFTGLHNMAQLEAEPFFARVIEQQVPRLIGSLQKNIAGASELADRIRNTIAPEFMHPRDMDIASNKFRAAMRNNAAINETIGNYIPSSEGTGRQTIRSAVNAGVDIAKLITIERTTGVPFEYIMAADAATANADKPLPELAEETGKAFLLGKLYRHGPGKVASLAKSSATAVEAIANRFPQTFTRTLGGTLFGGATLVEQLAQGKSIQDALPATFSQAIIGAALGGPEPAKQYRHADFGIVTEAESQAGVPRGKLRVTDEQGVEHVIVKPSTVRNQRAIPIKGEEANAQRQVFTETGSPSEGDRQVRSEAGNAPGESEVGGVRNRGQESQEGTVASRGPLTWRERYRLRGQIARASKDYYNTMRKYADIPWDDPRYEAASAEVEAARVKADRLVAELHFGTGGRYVTPEERAALHDRWLADIQIPLEDQRAANNSEYGDIAAKYRTRPLTVPEEPTISAEPAKRFEQPLQTATAVPQEPAQEVPLQAAQPVKAETTAPTAIPQGGEKPPYLTDAEWKLAQPEMTLAEENAMPEDDWHMRQRGLNLMGRHRETNKFLDFLQSKGVNVDAFRPNRDEPWGNHITHVTEQPDGSWEVRIEHHTPESSSAELVNVVAGESLPVKSNLEFRKGQGTVAIRENGTATNPLQRPTAIPEQRAKPRYYSVRARSSPADIFGTTTTLDPVSHSQGSIEVRTDAQGNKSAIPNYTNYFAPESLRKVFPDITEEQFNTRSVKPVALEDGEGGQLNVRDAASPASGVEGKQPWEMTREEFQRFHESGSTSKLPIRHKLSADEYQKAPLVQRMADNVRLIAERAPELVDEFAEPLRRLFRGVRDYPEAIKPEGGKSSERHGSLVFLTRHLAEEGLDIDPSTGGQTWPDVPGLDLLRLRVRANDAYRNGNDSLGDALEGLRDHIIAANEASGGKGLMLQIDDTLRNPKTLRMVQAHEQIHHMDMRSGGLNEQERERLFHSPQWKELTDAMYDYDWHRIGALPGDNSFLASELLSYGLTNNYGILGKNWNVPRAVVRDALKQLIIGLHNSVGEGNLNEITKFAAKSQLRIVREAQRERASNAPTASRSEIPSEPPAPTANIPTRRRASVRTGDREVDSELEPEWSRLHRLHVEQALQEGKAVPPEVLADYPDLQAGVSEPQPSLVGQVSEIVDERGNLTRGGDYINSLMKGRSDQDVTELLQWARTQGPNVQRFVGGNAIAELRTRGIDAKDIPFASQTSEAQNVPREPATSAAEPIRETRLPATQAVAGAQTEVSVPDSDRTYRAQYVVREAEDVIPSHNSQNFQPRSDYYHINDRQYEREPQYQLQVIDRSRPEKFNPRAVVNNSPTSEVGPPIIDSDGNVLGGNSRAMIIERIYAANDPRARDVYRQALIDQARFYGVDPNEVMAMKRPVLVRELSDANIQRPEVQRIITELNRVSTTPLTAAEQSITAARQLSEGATEFITDMLERGGEDATVATVMNESGPAIINKLIEDGIIQPGERNTLLKDGKATSEAKTRVENLLVSGIYRDLKQMEVTPPGIRRNIERLAVPLKTLAGTEWDVGDKLRTAIDAINEARDTTGGDLDILAKQISMLREPYTADEIALAKTLRLGPRKTAEKFRRYAKDQADAQSGGGLFGAPTREESLKVHFGIDTIVRPDLNPVVNEVSSRIIAAAEEGNLGNLSAAMREAPPEARMRIQGLASEIAKEQTSGTEKPSIVGRVAESGQEGAKVPEYDPSTANQSRPVSEVPAEPGVNTATTASVSSESGKIDVDLLTLGARPFAKDVALKVGQGVRGIRDIDDAVKSTLAPSTRAPQAKSTALSTRANVGEMERQNAIAERSLEGARKFFSKQTPQSNYEFIDRMERGQVQAEPHTQQFADILRQSFDLRRDQIRSLGTGKLGTFIEDYFPHIWKDPAKASAVFGSGRRPFEGQKSFLKQRTIPFTSEGLAAGLEPVSSNPIDLAVLKLREMDKYLMAHRVLGEMKDAGTLKFFKVSEQLPDGWKQIDDRVSTVYSRGESGEIILRGRYAAPEPAAKIINNYLSPGIEATVLREPFKAWRATANFMNQFQLGFSAFHVGFTTLDAAISRAAVGLEDVLTYGKPLRALKTIASTPISPITNLIQGSKMLREYYEPGSQGAEIAQYVDALAQGGGRAKQDRFYTNQAIRSFTDALKQGNIIGSVFRAPGAAVELLAKPTMEFLVPRQKMGVFAEMAKRELERLGPDATQEQTREAMSRAWDSVDNRMGQMIYDNLFWHKITKDLAMSSVRSVGWNLGTAREVGGGIADYVSLPKRALDSGRTDPLFTHRMAYTTALPLIVGTMGAMTQYLLTGKGPDELKDYFFPKTGNLDESGSAERIAFPSYMKDIFPLLDRVKHRDIGGLVTTSSHMITSKAHPLIGMVGEMLSNRDYYGTEIRNPDDPLVQQLKDSAAHVATSLTPFAIRGYQKEQERDTAAWRRILPFVGVIPAPNYLNQSEAERLLSEKMRERIPPGSRTKAEAERSQLKHQLESKMRRGQPVGQSVEDAIKVGTLTRDDVKSIVAASHLEPLQIRFEKLGIDDALDVYDLMTGAERVKVRPILSAKRLRLFGLDPKSGNFTKPSELRGTPAEKLALRERLNKALGIVAVPEP